MTRLPNLVVTKTPLRVSFLGGGTDINYFYRKHGGAVISAAIDKYVYVTVKKYSKLYKTKYRLNYSITENTNDINKIKNNIIRECIKISKINFPIYISIVSDVPVGSGLGGSSSVVVGLIKALYELKGEKISKEQLYDLACKIEIKKLNQPIGKQDQFPAVYGGLNFIEFKKNETVNFNKININNFNKNLFNNALLVWTEISRSASNELLNQKKKFKKNEHNLIEIKNLLYDLKKNTKFKNVSLKIFGDYIKKSWEKKSKIIKNNKNSSINQFIKNNNDYFYATKILGAGAGGFWLFILKANKKKKFLIKFKKYLTSSISISKSGAEIISRS
jgi:D-glycero-alpha-D-manno-heptose-7-phosphate kinase